MNKITPRWLYAGMLISLPLNTALCLWTDGWNWGRMIGRGLAFALAAGFCLRIAHEYQRGSLLRLAWLLLASSAAVSLLRQIPDAHGIGNLPYLHTYDDSMGIVSLILLLIGISVMVKAFSKTGLGFSIKYRDIFGVILMFVFLSIILVRHEYLSGARFFWPVPEYLQLFSQVLTAAAAAVAIVLHRFSVEMGGGKLAIAMRLLVIHIALRLTLVLNDVIFGGFLQMHPAAYLAAESCYDATAWIFTLAACYRALMLTDALKQAPPKPEDILAITLPHNWNDEVVAVCADASHSGFNSK